MFSYLPDLNNTGLKIPIPKPKKKKVDSTNRLRKTLQCCKCNTILSREEIIFRKGMKYCEDCFPKVLENVYTRIDPFKEVHCVKCRVKLPKNQMISQNAALWIYKCKECHEG